MAANKQGKPLDSNKELMATPEIHENSVDSELISQIDTNLAGKDERTGRALRSKFNAGALTDPFNFYPELHNPTVGEPNLSPEDTEL